MVLTSSCCPLLTIITALFSPMIVKQNNQWWYLSSCKHTLCQKRQSLKRGFTMATIHTCKHQQGKRWRSIGYDLGKSSNCIQLSILLQHVSRQNTWNRHVQVSKGSLIEIHVSEDPLGSHDESFLLKCKREVIFPFFSRGYPNRAGIQRPARFIFSGNCPVSKHHGSSIIWARNWSKLIIHRRGLLIRNHGTSHN